MLTKLLLKGMIISKIKLLFLLIFLKIIKEIIIAKYKIELIILLRGKKKLVNSAKIDNKIAPIIEFNIIFSNLFTIFFKYIFPRKKNIEFVNNENMKISSINEFKI